MASPCPSPPLSVILEWETGEECGGGRAARCLAEINRQMWHAARERASPPELILVPDPGARRSAAAAADGLAWPGRFEVAEPPAPLDYYEKKNFGFAMACGGIVVFVDSDLAPEPDWLEAITRPFADPSRSVVIGLTHFECGSLYERALALFWIFEARCGESLVRPTHRLVSNNVAFRRALFAALPFPRRQGYRGQCSELGATLGRLGIAMYQATGARAAHPAPAGARAFARRAFRAGRDARAYRTIEGGVHARGWLAEWRRDLAAVGARIAARAPAIGAGFRDRSAATLLGALYYSIKAAGFLTTPVRAPAPEPAREPEPSR